MHSHSLREPSADLAPNEYPCASIMDGEYKYIRMKPENLRAIIGAHHHHKLGEYCGRLIKDVCARSGANPGGRPTVIRGATDCSGGGGHVDDDQVNI